MKTLIKKLKEAAYAYYALDSPIMSDKEYDELYDKLTALEAETGIILAGSPTQKVQGYTLDGFTKVNHTKLMLSAAKTKDTAEIKKFLEKNAYYGSFKLDGLTLVVRYENGEFVQGITRGNGKIGEEVTEACRFIGNLPMKIPYAGNLELRGECVISWQEFERVNKSLKEPYKHPRNLAAGTLRNLDLNIVKERSLSFVVFECVTDFDVTSKSETLTAIENMGFEVVKRSAVNESVDDIVRLLDPENYIYPCDGIIFELDDAEYSRSLGATGHHENCRMALKWADDVYETTLRNIEWTTSRTGLINPVAVFDEVDLDGAATTRATLHNISYIENLKLGIGDTIEVYRANMVIPKVHSNLTQSNTWRLPEKCPCCGGDVEAHNDNGSKTLHCCNNACSAKLLFRLTNFVSKKGMNIDGLSEATLEKLVDLKWVTNLNDLYHLAQYFPRLEKMTGFGKKSVINLASAIQSSKDVSLANFVTALGIPGIGEGQTKILLKGFYSWEDFAAAGMGDFDFSRFDGIGDVLNKNIHDWFKTMYFVDHVEELAKIMKFKEAVKISTSQTLNGKTFVVTGSLQQFKSRDELKNKIESLGGKVSGSISAKTNYLINNDSESKSSKNLKAVQLGIPVITEQQFLEIIE